MNWFIRGDARRTSASGLCTGMVASFYGKEDVLMKLPSRSHPLRPPLDLVDDTIDPMEKGGPSSVGFPAGLTTAESQERLHQYGPNRRVNPSMRQSIRDSLLNTFLSNWNLAASMLEVPKSSLRHETLSLVRIQLVTRSPVPSAIFFHCSSSR